MGVLGYNRTMWLGKKRHVSPMAEAGRDASCICLLPCLRDLRTLSPRWDSCKMEKSDQHGLWHEGNANFDCVKILKLGGLSVTQLMLISLTNTIINSHSWIMFSGYSWVKPNLGLTSHFSPFGFLPLDPRAGQQMVHSSIPHSSLSPNNEVFQLRTDISLLPTTPWLDLGICFCLTAIGVGSIILLGAGEKMKAFFPEMGEF